MLGWTVSSQSQLDYKVLNYTTEICKDYVATEWSQHIHHVFFFLGSWHSSAKSAIKHKAITHHILKLATKYTAIGMTIRHNTVKKSITSMSIIYTYIWIQDLDRAHQPTPTVNITATTSGFKSKANYGFNLDFSNDDDNVLHAAPNYQPIGCLVRALMNNQFEAAAPSWPSTFNTTARSIGLQLRHHINALHRDVVHFSSAWKQITSGITLRPKDRTSPSIQLPTDILKK